MLKLYRININHFKDPLEDKRLLQLVDDSRRQKVLRYLMPEDRKRSLGAGIIIRKILNENGLCEDCLKYSENGKPVADNVFFNISHGGDYVVGVASDCEIGCDIEKNGNAPLEVAERYFYLSELEYIRSAADKSRAFFTLWTLKESYVKQSGQGMTVKLTDFAFQPELDPGWREVPCTDEKVGAMQCKLKEKWILSVCVEKLQADERMTTEKIVIREITTKEKEWMEHE